MLYCLLLPHTRIVKYLYAPNKNIYTLKTIVILVIMYSKLTECVKCIDEGMLCHIVLSRSSNLQTRCVLQSVTYVTKKLEAFSDFC